VGVGAGEAGQTGSVVVVVVADLDANGGGEDNADDNGLRGLRTAFWNRRRKNVSYGNFSLKGL
jgi:hypothetical protein